MKPAQAFRDLVADVARLQIGENKHVGMTGDRESREP